MNIDLAENLRSTEVIEHESSVSSPLIDSILSGEYPRKFYEITNDRYPVNRFMPFFPAFLAIHKLIDDSVKEEFVNKMFPQERHVLALKVEHEYTPKLFTDYQHERAGLSNFANFLYFFNPIMLYHNVTRERLEELIREEAELNIKREKWEYASYIITAYNKIFADEGTTFNRRKVAKVRSNLLEEINFRIEYASRGPIEIDDVISLLSEYINCYILLGGKFKQNTDLDRIVDIMEEKTTYLCENLTNQSNLLESINMGASVLLYRQNQGVKIQSMARLPHSLNF